MNINELIRPRKLCLCRGVTKADVEKAVKNGVNTMKQLIKVTAATTGCGSCFLDVKAYFEYVLHEHKNAQSTLPLE